MKNIYCNPEYFDLQVIGDVDIADIYEFNILLVLQNIITKKLYYLQDSGCSCPTPFEDATIDCLQLITKDNMKYFESLCFNHKPANRSYDRPLKDQILWYDPSLVLYNKVFNLL